MQKPVIRQAVIGDAPSLAEIARAAYRHYTARMGRDPAPMHADFGTHIARDTVIVAEMGKDTGSSAASKITGYAVLIETSSGWLLDNIAVRPGNQGRGIGGALIEWCEEFLQQRGQTGYSLYTNAAMSENLNWYMALGFNETDRRVEQGFHRIYMEKIFFKPEGGDE